ncbi:MAG: gamma-glutamyltransferase [Holophagaceae bacterium]|nr:gamma-glutamyltransferase [Holophagaceae bacterium]
MAFALLAGPAADPVAGPSRNLPGLLRGMVVAQERQAAEAGAQVLREGGTAIDAAVATAFALAVTHPVAGNLGGGGFLLARSANGAAQVYDFRETAPGRARPGMWLRAGRYDQREHHDSLRSVGTPGSVAGLHAAWKAGGRLPWARLVEPARKLAAEGFIVSPTLSDSLKQSLPAFRKHGPTLAVFSRKGRPFEPGERLRQPDLARTLARIQIEGPEDFYRGRTARLLVRMMVKEGGLLRRRDLAGYRVEVRAPLAGTYRGHEVLTVPPPSGGGIALLEMLNTLEGYDLAARGPLTTEGSHLVAEAMRAAYRDRARFVGDPAFAPAMPVERLISKAYAAELRSAIDPQRALRSSLEGFETGEPEHTTHLSVVDREGNAVSLTTTLEDYYGLKRIVPGAGFFLNNEMGDFNAVPGRTDATGMVGTAPNLSRPGARPLSSMSPTLLVKDGGVFLVTGSPGGRTIPNTTLHTILNVVDAGLDAQAAVDAPRFHHQWFPDRVQVEPGARYPPGFLDALRAKGHRVVERETRQGVAQVILVRRGQPSGGADGSRGADSAAVAE